METDEAEPAIVEQRRDVDRDVIQAWLDALSTGACDESAFLKAVLKLSRRSPDAGWDSLSLLDQYYRLGKVETEVFNSLKSSLGSQLVGQSPQAQISVPLPRPAPPVQGPSPAQTRPAPAPQPPVLAEPASPVQPAQAAPPPVVQRPTVQRQPVPAALATAQTVPVEVPAKSNDAPESTRTRPRNAAAARRTVRREIAVGDVLRGRYAIKSVLGRGGAGMVFEAADLYRLDLPDSGQRVALKVLHSQVSGQPEMLAELQREFQMLQSLSHPNIVRAFDYDRDGDIAFFTMEYLRGLSLTGVLAARNQTPLDRPHALAIVRDIGAALAHAHSRTVVHGDLNPGNVFITNEGEVRVLDFGAAHAPSGPTVSASQSEHIPVATPHYASYQVLNGKRADARDDLYALACVAYVLLAGAHPFSEKTASQAYEERLKPHRPSNVNSKEWQALRRGLSFDREKRPSDVAEWLTAFDWDDAPRRLPVLLALVRVTPHRRRRVWLPVLGAVAVILLAAGAWAVLNADSARGAALQASTAVQQVLAVTRSKLTELWANARSASGSAVAARATPALQSAGAAVDATPTQAEVPAPTPAVPPSGPTSELQPAPESASAPASVPASASESAPASTPEPASTAPPPIAILNSHAHLSADVGANPVLPHAASPPAVLASQSRISIELAADTVDVPLTDPAARVVVRRKGSTRGEASFSWWTESGTAKPGRDFIAVTPHQETIEDGKSSVNLFIPVVGDANRHDPKSFYIVINDPSDGASLGARTLTMVTIPASD